MNINNININNIKQCGKALTQAQCGVENNIKLTLPDLITA